MLHSRDSDSIRRVIQAQRALMESDEEERRAERKGHGGDVEGLVRAASMRLRRARGSNDAHDIGVRLHQDSPEAHSILVKTLGDDHPHRVAVAVAPHLQRYTDADRKARDGLWGAEGQKLRQARGEAFDRFRRSAEAQGVRNPGHLMHAHDDEDMADHLDRIYHRVHGLQYRGYDEHSGNERHEGSFDDKQEALDAAATAKKLYGKTHDVDVRERGVGKWHVTTSKKRDD